MTLAIRIIPCLDIAGERVVKGVNFQGLVDSGDPLELAAKYYHDGADELTFLDVNATHEARSTMLDLVQRTAQSVFVPLTVGGGVRSVEDVEALLAAGADKISIASAALNRPELLSDIAKRFGNQVLVLSLDAARGSTRSGYEATSNGGRVRTGVDAIEWIKKATDLGVGEVLVNSIDADGTKSGFDLAMLNDVMSATSTPVIASGGAGELRHFIEVANTGVDAILAASVFHSGTFSIGEVKHALSAAGFVVRK